MTSAAFSNASTAYGATDGTPFATRCAKSVEYELFSRVTHQLALASRSKKSDFPSLVRCLHENRRLWTTLAADVLDIDNPLPSDLRSRVVYLSQFVQLHSAKILSGQAKVRPLIEVNLAVMKGLKKPEAVQ